MTNTLAADFDSLQSLLRHERDAGATHVYVTDLGKRFVVKKGTARRWHEHEVYFAHGKYHVDRAYTARSALPESAVLIDRYLATGAGLVDVTAESASVARPAGALVAAPTAAETAPVLYEQAASPTRAKKNEEGLTYDEWYNAANAFGQVINPEKARKEWAAGVDPTEWAARVSAAPSRARALVWHRNKKGGLYAENYDVKPSKGPRGGDGWWKVVKDGHVHVAGPIHLIADAKAAAQADFDFIVRAHTGSPVASESGPATEAVCVPWVKVTRDPERYEACLATAKKIGPMKDAASVYQLLHDALAKEDQEVFLVVLVDVRDQLRGVAEVHRGARSEVMVSVQDVLRPVIVSGAETFFVVHPHPSGKADPSDADLSLTKQIVKACKPFSRSMTFRDHVIIGMNEYYSFRKHEPSLFEKKGE